MTDFEAFFILDKELAEAPLLDDSQRVLIRKWLHRFVETKLKGKEEQDGRGN